MTPGLQVSENVFRNSKNSGDGHEHGITHHQLTTEFNDPVPQHSLILLTHQSSELDPTSLETVSRFHPVQVQQAIGTRHCQLLLETRGVFRYADNDSPLWIFSSPSHHYNLSTWLQKTQHLFRNETSMVCDSAWRTHTSNARFPKNLFCPLSLRKFPTKIRCKIFDVQNVANRGLWSGTSDSEWLGMKDTDSSSIRWMPLF